MARARDQAEDLGCRVEEVEDLGNQQKRKRLGEVAQNTDDGEDHAGEVAVRVADEYLGGVPVVPEQGERHAYPGKKEVEREEMRVGGRVRVRAEQVETVVEDENAGDGYALGHFDAVDAC